MWPNKAGLVKKYIYSQIQVADEEKAATFPIGEE